MKRIKFPPSGWKTFQVSDGLIVAGDYHGRVFEHVPADNSLREIPQPPPLPEVPLPAEPRRRRRKPQRKD